MKRRENILSPSSSARRETIPVNNQTTKNVGCMSGIFHLVSKYQHRRKLLTSAKQQDRSTISSSPNTKPKSSAPEIKSLVLEKTPPPPSDSDFKRFSFEVPRSPTIPSEIRLSKNSIDDKPEENLQRSPALVARLMGLNDLPPALPSPVSSSEKRRKLMVALEKCDEDLKALKNIIETIRSTKNDEVDHHLRTSPAVEAVVAVAKNIDSWRSGGSSVKSTKGRLSGGINNKYWDEQVVKSRASCYEEMLIFGEVDGPDSTRKENSCSDDNNNSEQEQEQPSPVSVLDQISTSSPPSNNNSHSRSLVHHQYQIGEKYTKLREEVNSFSFQRNTFEALPRLSGRRGGGGGVYDRDNCQPYFRSLSSTTNKAAGISTVAIQSNNKTKVGSVNEVCLDAVWAERWELGRICVVLQDYIFEELIEEIVRDLGWSCYNYMYSSVFRLEACRKRLRF